MPGRSRAWKTRWRPMARCAPGRARFLGEWLRGLAGGAVLSGAGQGLRQVQRRIKAWTGQSHRDLQRYSRVEDAMARMSAHRRDGGIDWAGLAGGAGFADQSHLGREVRRVTGLSPARLEARIAQDEAFWFTACWASTSGGLTACRPRPVPADGKKPVSAALQLFRQGRHGRGGAGDLLADGVGFPGHAAHG